MQADRHRRHNLSRPTQPGLIRPLLQQLECRHQHALPAGASTARQPLSTHTNVTRVCWDSGFSARGGQTSSDTSLFLSYTERAYFSEKTQPASTIIVKAVFCYYCSPVYHTTRLFQFFFQHIQHCILQLINIVVNLFAVYFIRMLLLERIFSTKSVIFRNPVCALLLRTSPEAD